MAFIIAAVADVVQFPLSLAALTGILTVPSELLDKGIDVAVLVVVSRCLGFHWILLPGFLLEFIPGLELAPTWTACVAYMVWQQKQKHVRSPSVTVVVDAEVIPQRPPLLPPLSSPDFGQTNKNT